MRRNRIGRGSLPATCRSSPDGNLPHKVRIDRESRLILAGPPPVNYGTRPTQTADQYKPIAAPPPPTYDNAQQGGQIAFDEKFQPADGKPKWNDVTLFWSFLRIALGGDFVPGGLYCVCCGFGILFECVSNYIWIPRKWNLRFFK
jgi:hypothetical protein